MQRYKILNAQIIFMNRADCLDTYSIYLFKIYNTMSHLLVKQYHIITDK